MNYVSSTDDAILLYMTIENGVNTLICMDFKRNHKLG